MKKNRIQQNGHYDAGIIKLTEEEQQKLKNLDKFNAKLLQDIGQLAIQLEQLKSQQIQKMNELIKSQEMLNNCVTETAIKYGIEVQSPTAKKYHINLTDPVLAFKPQDDG